MIMVIFIRSRAYGMALQGGRMRTSRWIAALAALSLVAGACGGDDDAADPTTPNTDEDTPTTDADGTDSTTPSTDDDATDSTTPSTDDTDSTEPPQEPDLSSATLRFGIVSSAPDSLDPHLNTQSYGPQWYGGAYESLVLLESSGEIQPALATSWEYADDGLSLTFTLREGVNFHDGTAFDADAVKANIERAQTIENSAVASDLAIVASVEVIDPATVTFNFVEPTAIALNSLAGRPGMMISPAAFGGAVDLDVQTVGTGPYQIVEYEVGQRATYERFDGYWGEPGGVRTIEISLFDDTSAGSNALRTDQIDMYELRLTPEQLDDLRSAGIEVTEIPRHAYIWMALNFATKFEDKRVREAISYAIDRQLIADTLGEGEPTWQWVPPGDPAYSENLENLHPYDPEMAISLLEEAGYGEGEFQFTLAVPAREAEQTLAQILQAMLLDVGVVMDLAPAEGATIVQTCYVDHVCDAITGTHGTKLDVAEEAQDIIAPGGRRNLAGDATIDELWALTQEALVPSDDRQTLLVELNEMASREVVTVAILVDPIVMGSQPRVTDFSVDGFDNIIYSSVRISE